MDTTSLQLLETKPTAADFMSFLGKGTPRLLNEMSSQNENLFKGLLGGRVWKTTEEQEAARFLKATLEEIMKGHIARNNKIGIMLSGGFDSTVLAYFLRDYTENVTCYVSCFPEFDNVNEVDFSSYVAEQYGLELKIVEIEFDRYKTLLDELINVADSPVVTWTAITQLAISKQAKKDQCDVLVSGLGSDELFGGFSQMGEIYGQYKKKIPNEYWEAILNEAPLARSLKLFKGNVSPFSYEQLHDLFPEEFSENQVEDNIVDLYRKLHDEYPESDVSAFMSYLERVQRLENILIPDFGLSEKITGIPLCYPFLDDRLWKQFLNLNIDLRWKFVHEGSQLKHYYSGHEGIDKYVLRLAFQEEVPERVQKRKPMGYTTPFAWWITKENYRQSLRKIVEDSPLWKELKIDQKQLEVIFDLDKYRAEPASQWKQPFQIWILFALASWYNKTNTNHEN